MYTPLERYIRNITWLKFLTKKKKNNWILPFELLLLRDLCSQVCLRSSLQYWQKQPWSTMARHTRAQIQSGWTSKPEKTAKIEQDKNNSVHISRDLCLLMPQKIQKWGIFWNLTVPKKNKRIPISSNFSMEDNRCRHNCESIGQRSVSTITSYILTPFSFPFSFFLPQGLDCHMATYRVFWICKLLAMYMQHQINRTIYLIST